MIQSTLLAKGAYWLAGQLSRIKTSQMTWEWVNPEEVFATPDDEPLPEFDMREAGKMKLPHPWGLKLLSLSQRLDEKHWDHWALEHSLCEGTVCASCKGHVDPEQVDEW